MYIPCMRLFATSDLHTDYKDNMLWLRQLSGTAYRNDVLIVAGDISDRFQIIRETLLLLRSKFRHVLFTPGNHELWVRGEASNSVDKLQRILTLCDELDVATAPLRLEDLWVVPLFSWYDGVFDPEMTTESEAARRSWADFHFCKWPEDATPLADYFLRMNEPRLKEYDAPVVTFSHFLPRADLLPPVEYLKISWLPNVSICAGLDSQIRSLSSTIHVCGHTHISVDDVIDGIRYVQNPVRYPKERKPESIPVKMIWSNEETDPTPTPLQPESYASRY
jgi:predicted phosphodiesterase